MWDLNDKVERSDIGTNVVSQIKMLSGLPEEVRSLRERIERMQSTGNSDKDNNELLARQLRTEMQNEREERNDLRHKAEFLEQMNTDFVERVKSSEEVSQRIQDSLAMQQQRMEQTDINTAATNARIGANADAIRRVQTEVRALSNNLDRYDRIVEELTQRIAQLEEAASKFKEDASGIRDFLDENESFQREHLSMRQSNDETTDRLAAVVRDSEVVRNNIDEIERAVERIRTRSDQQDRALAELRSVVNQTEDIVSRENERFLDFQEKIRRRQIGDLEQEVRELKGRGRSNPNG
jgi:chromosome segregation ATPase